MSTTPDWMDTETDVDRWPDAAGWSDPDQEATSTHAQFDGDVGGLGLAQRKALVVLLKNRFITAASHPDEWRALISDPLPIRIRLNDMFLRLRLDTGREVAFKEQVMSPTSTRFPTLLHLTEWSREETILLVHLRSLAYAAQAAGDPRVFVDRLDLLEHVASMRPDHATDQSRDNRSAQRAIESLLSSGVLVGRRDADRFEVSPALDAILPLDRLQELLAALRADDPTAAPETDQVSTPTNEVPA